MSKIFEMDDFVVAIEMIGEIEKNAVGVVKTIENEKITVFFIGKKQMVTTDKSNIQPLDITQTGKPYEVKICNICHILKPNDAFEINQTDAKGQKTTRPSCRSCRVVINGVKMPNSESKRMDSIKPKLLFTCPICQKMSIVGVTANIVKDHNHQTGMGREWLCDSCNTGLGRFKDDIRFFEHIIAYLKKHEA